MMVRESETPRFPRLLSGRSIVHFVGEPPLSTGLWLMVLAIDAEGFGSTRENPITAWYGMGSDSL